MTKESIYIYGPPGCGKSAVGQMLAARLKIDFYDLDHEIEHQQGRSIPQIFSSPGEEGFRKIEAALLRETPEGVIALGGGTLLERANRDWVEEHGQVLVLDAAFPALLERLSLSPNGRPLLQGDLAHKLAALLQSRAEHYASFNKRVDTTYLSIEETVWRIQIELGRFILESMGNRSVRFQRDGLALLGNWLQEQRSSGQIALISDENVSALYAERVLESIRGSGYKVFSLIISPGEEHKNLETLAWIWDSLLENKLERDGLVIALGGGVVSDLAGFAAATYLRGIRWAAIPSTLLGMIDASLGGKTGIDLPRGKNLAGAFYPPEFVLSDPGLLATLPEREWRSGFAEVVKHAVIADPVLFDRCKEFAGYPSNEWNTETLDEVIRRAAAVKIQIIEHDPYEKGLREALNYGHTVGHALETASGFRLLHGEAVAIGMVIEANLAEALRLASPGISGEIAALLKELGLPIDLSNDLDFEKIEQAMQVDKKRKQGKLRFSLPLDIGTVQVGVEISETRRKNAMYTGPAWAKSELIGKARA